MLRVHNCQQVYAHAALYAEVVTRLHQGWTKFTRGAPELSALNTGAFPPLSGDRSGHSRQATTMLVVRTNEAALIEG